MPLPRNYAVKSKREGEEMHEGISMAALERAMSRERLQAYRLPGDADEADGIARWRSPFATR